MKFIVKPSKISGDIEIPSSKSHTLRAILFALMGEGKSTVYKYLQSPDAIAMIEAIKLFGAQVEMFPDRLEIIGVGSKFSPTEDVIDAGNSGQVLRFVGALAALVPSYTVITGDHSIRHNRPVKPLLSALSQLGVFAESMRLDGYAPIIIKGPMRGGTTQLEGQDSQPVSGLIIASAFAKNKTEISVRNPGEKPWIDLTLYWLDLLGIKYENYQYERYVISGNSHYKGFNYTVPADFSSMAFPLAAALITNSSVNLENIDISDVQGDKKILDALFEMGANISTKERTVHVEKGSILQGKKLDINDYIDAIAILAVIGCYSEGETEICNATIARAKECDRIHAMTTELKKMGADIEEKKDGVIVRRSKLNGANLESYKDHRIAMSLTVAALGAEGESAINGVECINKTYPTFSQDMQELGANITVET